MRKIHYSDIIKRKIALESSIDPIIEGNCKLYNTRAKKSFNPDDVVKFMAECSSSANSATSYLSDIIFMVENVSDPRVLSLFESDILPKVKVDQLPSIVDETTNVRISEQIKINKICDRILENHNMIMKKGIDNFVKENVDLLANKCCDIVSKNQLPLHGKICVSLEESKYLLESTGKDFDFSRVSSLVFDYFSIKEQFIGESEKILKAIKANNYISEAVDDVSGSPMTAIEIFKISPEKNSDLLKTAMEDILKVENYNLKANVSAFFDLLKEILISSSDEELCSSIYKEIIPAIYENIFNGRLEDPELKEIASSIKGLIDVELEISNMYVNRYNDEVVSNHMLHYMKAMEELYTKFTEIEDMTYTQYNIESMNSSIEESDTIISLDEFKIFKFQNILTMSRNIDNYFKEKLSGVRHKASKTMKKLKSKIFGESSVYDAVHEDGSIDFTVCTVESDVNNESHSEISGYCKAINESILYDTGYNCYYIANENSFDIHIKENCMVSLEESELKELKEYATLEVKTNIEKILEFSNYNISFDTEKIVDFFTEQSASVFRDFVEACSLANIDKEVVENIYESVFSNKTGEDHISFYHGTTSAIQLYEAVNAPAEIQLEALQLITAITEAKDDDEEEKKPSLKEKMQVKKDIKQNEKEEQKEKDKETYKKSSGNEDALKDPDKASIKEKREAKKDIKANAKLEKKEAKDAEKKDKDPFSGLKLNNIQLYLQGLKKKMKDMSAKEKEVCRQADSTFNNFAKACKNALISDRREAIIKGSVIPSFSKCVKTGIAMAGLYIVNPMAAIITAFGGLAMSKNLTKKERALLLDELEVELEMIDKEIQNADNKNQLKKERALMMEKKNLQRQYQRIKYNIRIGKDLVPSSSMGIKDTN